MSQTAESNSLWFMNGHVTVHLAMADHAGGFSITEHRMPAGFGPPYHVHHDEDETFYLLEGEIRCKQAERILHAKAGDAVHLSRGIPHGFKVVSSGGARVLIVSTGGFEAMLRAASIVAPSDSLPEPREPTLEMQTRLAQICAENGIELLGPPIDWNAEPLVLGVVQLQRRLQVRPPVTNSGGPEIGIGPEVWEPTERAAIATSQAELAAWPEARAHPHALFALTAV